MTLGATYKFSDQVMLGGSYQLKTALSDMETGSSGATLSTSLDMLPSVSGKITVNDFQMPSVLAVGGSWKVSPDVMLVADIKHIGWSEVMDNFRMRLDTSMGSVSFEIPQKWKDQTVLNLGVAWAATEALTLRAGLNLADNPVPDQYVHPLFPAIEKNHLTLGFGYHLSKNDTFNASWSHVPTVTVTNPGNPATGSPPIVITHGQNNLQFNYVRAF
jgi:long-chain fatty acid transport protein